MTLTIGNIVKPVGGTRHGIILAVRRDGTAAKIFDYTTDTEVWRAPRKFTVEVSGMHQCYKCLGSGLYYMGGAVVNGTYTGKTGICFACEGKGEQSDEDRRRCHYYWHRKVEEGEQIERPLEPTPQQPLREEPKAEPKKKVKIRSKKRDPRSTVVQKADKLDHLREQPDVLIDCKGCGTVHRDDTLCPW